MIHFDLVTAPGPSRAAQTPLIHRDIAAVASALLVPLIASQIAWDHYFLLASPAILFVSRPGRGSARRRFLAGIALVLCAVTPIRMVLAGVSSWTLAVSVSVGTATLFALLLWDLANPETSNDSTAWRQPSTRSA